MKTADRLFLPTAFITLAADWIENINAVALGDYFPLGILGAEKNYWKKETRFFLIMRSSDNYKFGFVDVKVTIDEQFSAV